jgi:ribosome-binding protein aMBF1 (putative translation factor)
MRKRELERQIKKIIKEEYDWQLGVYREDLPYSKAVEPFVSALANLLKDPNIRGGRKPKTINPKESCLDQDPEERKAYSRLKQLRLDRGLSTAELGWRIKYCEAFLNELEKGTLILPADVPAHVLKGMNGTKEEMHYVFGC